MGIGKRIKEARINKDLKQEELAALVGVTPAAIGNYENDYSHPKEPVLYKLFEALEVDPNFLFQDMVKIDNSKLQISEKDRCVVGKYNKLNDVGKKKAETYIDDLLAVPVYCIEFNTAKSAKDGLKLVAESPISVPPKKMKKIRHT